MEGYYILGVWACQAVLYLVILLDVVNFKIRKSLIVSIAFILFFIAPWIFPVENDFNPETGEGRYMCGLASLIPISIFWVMGNIGNILLLVAFYIIESLKKSRQFKIKA